MFSLRLISTQLDVLTAPPSGIMSTTVKLYETLPELPTIPCQANAQSLTNRLH